MLFRSTYTGLFDHFISEEKIELKQISNKHPNKHHSLTSYLGERVVSEIEFLVFCRDVRFTLAFVSGAETREN